MDCNQHDLLHIGSSVLKCNTISTLGAHSGREPVCPLPGGALLATEQGGRGASTAGLLFQQWTPRNRSDEEKEWWKPWRNAFSISTGWIVLWSLMRRKAWPTYCA